NLCYRIADASYSQALLLARLTKKTTVDFASPSDKEVWWTNRMHPDPQCRLDTMIAGALCLQDFDEHILPKDEQTAMLYSCSQLDYAVGFRPRCWFKPRGN